MEEGTFVRWLKREGESVKAGEPLFELEGEKAAQEIEALDSGILRIHAQAPPPGTVVKVGTLLGHLVASTEPVVQIAPPPVTTPNDGVGAPAAGLRSTLSRDLSGSETAPAAAVSPRETARVDAEPTKRISPRARRRATQLGVEWTELTGSGRTGRIVESDVLKIAAGGVVTEPSAMRRAIARRTAESFASVPHFYLRTEANATALLAARERLLPQIEAQVSVRLTLTDLILRAQALALRDCPFANKIWRGDALLSLPGTDIGLVVGLTEGLLIPVIRGTGDGTLSQLAAQRSRLVERARAGKLTETELSGGSTSLSNLGTSCVDEFTAVIPPGQSSILAVGAAALRPVVLQGQVVARTTVRLCLSVDHRVMDGGPASKFLERIVHHLETVQSWAAV